MTGRTFHDRISGGGDALDAILQLLDEQRVAFCVIGGLGVNAYCEPVVSLDLDIVLAAGQRETLIGMASAKFSVERFEHSVNLTMPGSDLRIQIQTDERYERFVDRACRRTVLGRVIPVAAVEDVLAGKVWAASDPSRRRSKRQKDLADIARLLEVRPDLGTLLPDPIRLQLTPE